MKVNRLGYKVLTELGYKSLKECYEVNNLGCSYYAFYDWCTKKTSPNNKLSLAIDKIAGMLDVSRNDVLNMISTEPNFNVGGVQGENLFKDKRAELGLTAKELAEIVECDMQMINDIENGKRKGFPDSTTLKNYLDALDISFTQFQETVKKLREENQRQDTARKRARREQGEKIMGNYTCMNYENAEDKPTDGCIENPAKTIFEGMNRQPLLPAEDMQKVMSLLYGKVDFHTFKQIERILGGDNT